MQYYYRDLSMGSMVAVVPRAPSKARGMSSSVNPCATRSLLIAEEAEGNDAL